MAKRKITTVAGDGRIGMTSLSKADDYVASGRAVWEHSDARHGGVRLYRIRFIDLDHRNTAADASANSKMAKRGFMPASDMTVADVRGMRGVPIMTPEKMLYKIPSVKARKPEPCVVLKVAGQRPDLYR